MYWTLEFGLQYWHKWAYRELGFRRDRFLNFTENGLSLATRAASDMY
jgi:hypothetical protein